MVGADSAPDLEPSDRPQPNARRHLLPEIAPAVWLPEGARRRLVSARAYCVRRAGGLSGGSGLGDLGYYASLRADVHLHPQAELAGQGEQGVHGRVVLGGFQPR
jgi:hypothetical protein